MGDIIDMGVTAEAHRILERLLSQHGLNYFMARDGKRFLALDKQKIELVVSAAIKVCERRDRTVHHQAVEHCRKLVRRELIRRVALELVGTGC